MDKTTPKKDNSSYQRWYAAHKEELSQKRRLRYDSDSDYRERVLAKNRDYRKKRSQVIGEERRLQGRKPKQRNPVTIDVELNGVSKKVELVHIGTFAREIDRSVPTVHQWERVGVLPRTPFFAGGKDKKERIYTRDMIIVVKAALDKRSGSVSTSDHSFFREILEGWQKLGVKVDGTRTGGSDVGKAVG